jgi:uncharacterized protein YecE (DUF72 family)
VGTSGYSYAEWVQAGFYPAGTPAGRMLSIYARRFTITELNTTWYQMPTPGPLRHMMEQAPPDFGFTAKLTRTLTHEIDPHQWRGCAGQYREGITPLIQAGRLTTVLIQFPPTFNRTPGHRRYLASLLDELEGLPLAVEFRSASWAVDKVFAELERRRICLVTVDEPDLPGLFPALDVVTNPALFYVRFHGRNTRGWRSGNMQQQFDYHYSDEELQRWVQGPITAMTQKARCGVMLFNNHVRAQAPANGQRLMTLLARQGFDIARPQAPVDAPPSSPVNTRSPEDSRQWRH